MEKFFRRSIINNLIRLKNFYRNYQSRRKQNDSLAEIYQNVRWYDQSFHSILVEYAENL